MKKKLALALAVVMTATSMPTTLFAGTVNRINSLYVSNSGVNLLEYGWMTQPGSASAPATATDANLPRRSFFDLANTGLSLPPTGGSNPAGIYQLEVPYNGNVYANGTDLVLMADSTTGFVQGAQFTVTLNNANWNFADIKDANNNNISTTYDKKKGTWDANAKGGGLYNGTYYRGLKADQKRLAPYDMILDNGVNNPSVVTPGFGNPYPVDLVGGGIAPRASYALGNNASEAQKIAQAMTRVTDEVRYLDPSLPDYRPNSSVSAYKTAISNIANGFATALSESTAPNKDEYLTVLNAIQAAATSPTWTGITTTAAVSPAALNLNRARTSTRMGGTPMNDTDLTNAFLALLPPGAFTVISAEVAKASPVWPTILSALKDIAAVDQAVGELIAEEDIKRNGAFLARNVVGNLAAVEVPYTLQVSSVDSKTATITLLSSTNPSTTNLNVELRIPMVIKVSDTNTDVTATITSYISSVTSQTLFITNVSGTATKTSISSVKAAEEFRLDRITIDELRIGSIKNSGWFTLTAPSGYRFVNNFNDVAGAVEVAASNTAYQDKEPIVRVSVGGGLSWDTAPGRPSATQQNNNASLRGASAFGYNPITPVTGVPNYTIIGTTTIPLDTKIAWYGISNNNYYTSAYGNNNYWHNAYYNNPWMSIPPMYYQTPTGTAMGRGLYNTTATSNSGQSSLLTDYSIGYFYDVWAAQFDPSKVRVEFKNLLKATALPGKLYITGLKLVPSANAPETGDVNLTITNGDAGITTETFKIGERVARGIKFTAEATTNTLVSGRYPEKGFMSAENLHKAARVTFEESAVNAWWSGRTTEMVLETSTDKPNAAKFIKVRFEAPDNDLAKTNIAFNVAEESKRYFKTDLFPNNEPLNYSQNIRVTSDRIILNNIFVTDYKIAKFYIDTWLSVEADYEGEIKLSLTGTGVTDTDRSSAVIAKAMPAIKVTTDTTNVKIGYQEQDTKDIIIKENGAGYLQAGKTVSIDVTDRINQDIAFAAVASGAVTEGDLQITTPKIAGGKITFDILRQSTKPATISFTGVKVKINRNVPESSTIGYDIYVGGNAVAANWDNDKVDVIGDKFSTMGVKGDKKYISVEYPANDKLDLGAGILTDRVEIVANGTEKGYTKAGVLVTADPSGNAYDVSAYISPESNSTMVPFRMLGHAFGLTDEQVIWDPINETATLLTGSKVVQLKKDSDTIIINGVAVAMLSPDGLPVKAEIKDDRIFLPFRAMGNAFGVTVDWDQTTRTAIYNPSGFAGKQQATPGK